MRKFIFGSAWAGFIRFLFACGAACLLLIVAVTIWDVAARNAGFYAPIWLSTVVEFGLPVCTMLAAPYLVRQRAHVAMELIDGALSDRVKRLLIFLTDIIAAGVSLLVAYYAWLGGYDSWSRGEVVVLAIDVPRWILYAVLALGLLLCAIEFFRHAVLALCAWTNAQRSDAGGTS
jgi:TRAP-type C4-dicarboxylate transport system permease small subunit